MFCNETAATEIYTPAFRSGVRIPRDRLLRTELAIIAATPFRPQRELIYNCRRFAQGREPGSWSWLGVNLVLTLRFSSGLRVKIEMLLAPLAARFAISSIL